MVAEHAGRGGLIRNDDRFYIDTSNIYVFGLSAISVMESNTHASSKEYKIDTSSIYTWARSVMRYDGFIKPH